MRVRSFDFNDILSALTHIRGGIPALRLSSRIRLGEHRSVFFGPSYDFHDIQEYDPERDPPNQIIPNFVGPDDDVIYARRCIEQHDIKVMLMVDLSSSLDAGIDLIKRRMLLEAIGFIGVTATRYQDPLGLVGFTEKIVLNMPARSGSSNFFYLLKNVYDYLNSHSTGEDEQKRKTDYFIGLDLIRRTFNKRCLIPVISDFVNFDKVLNSPILRSVASRHEVIFIFLDDPLEFLSATGHGYVSMDDVESGERSIISRKKLTELEKNLRAERKELRNSLRRIGIQSVVLEYGANGRHFNRLHRFFLARHKLQGRQP